MRKQEGSAWPEEDAVFGAGWQEKNLEKWALVRLRKALHTILRNLNTTLQAMGSN